MIKLFEQYNDYYQVKSWLDKRRIKNYIINDDLTVDVNGNVQIDDKSITEIPVQFGKVSGDFNISYNNFTTLKGCPHSVGADFICSSNKLTSLKFSPKIVKIDFYCQQNKLTSLEGCPEYIGEDFYCHDNKITTLGYSPKILNGGFHYSGNNLPFEITSIDLDILILLKYQEEYGIWNSDGSLNKSRFDIFINDYNSDLLI